MTTRPTHILNSEFGIIIGISPDSVLQKLKQMRTKGEELICDVQSSLPTLKERAYRPYIQTYQRKSFDGTLKCNELCDRVSDVPKLKHTVQMMFQCFRV